MSYFYVCDTGSYFYFIPTICPKFLSLLPKLSCTNQCCKTDITKVVVSAILSVHKIPFAAVAHVVMAAGFTSHYLDNCLPYVQHHINLNK